MENWKKALVVVAFLATIGGLVATQYMQVRKEVSVTISEKLSDVQLVAFDKGVTTEYLLSNDTSANVLKMNLGSLCWHYRKTYTAAFAIVWAKNDAETSYALNISAIKIYQSEPYTTEVSNFPVKIYLHKDPTLPCEAGWGASTDSSGVLYYDGSSGGSQSVGANAFVLEPIPSGIVANPYSGSTLTYANWTDATHYKTFTATWTQPSGEGYIWIDDYAFGSSSDVPKADNLQQYSTYSGAGGANFVWVEIIVSPSGTDVAGSFSDYHLVIVVELLPT